MKKLEPYRNPDKRCTLPFIDDPLGSCFSYASHVDGYLSINELGTACEMCRYWIVPEQKSQIAIDNSQ